MCCLYLSERTLDADTDADLCLWHMSILGAACVSIRVLLLTSTLSDATDYAAFSHKSLPKNNLPY